MLKKNKCIWIIGCLLGLVSTGSVATESPSLTLAVHPYKSPTQLIAAYTPMVKYLDAELGVKINLSISVDYAAHIKTVGEDKVDFAYIGPAGYVELTKQYGKKQLLARQYINGRPVFSGKIIARQDSGLTNLAELKHRRFAFGDPASTMSHLVPRYMLWQSGVDVKNLAEHRFLGSHDNVALGVLAGDFDAGAVKEAVYYKYRDRGLIAIATTPELSEHLFVASGRMDEALFKRLRQALFDMSKSPDGLKALKKIKDSISSLGPVDDTDYDNLRVIMNKLEALGV